MAVKHVDDGIAPAAGLPIIRQIDKGVAVQVLGCDVDGKSLNHDGTSV